MYALTWEMVDWNGRMLDISTNENGEALRISLNNTPMAALKTAIGAEKRVGTSFARKRHAHLSKIGGIG